MSANPPASAGYSKRPLADKLGIKAGMRVAILNAPEGYERTLGALPEGVQAFDCTGGPISISSSFSHASGRRSKRRSLI